MGKSNFIFFLLKNRLENFVFFLGFIFAIMAYGLWEPLAEKFNLTDDQGYQLFYVCISVSFFFYTFAYFLTKYYQWRWFPMFVYLVCGSRVFLEVTSIEDSQTHSLIEYGLFVLTIFIVFGYWLKFKYKKHKENENIDPYNTD